MLYYPLFQNLCLLHIKYSCPSTRVFAKTPDENKVFVRILKTFEIEYDEKYIFKELNQIDVIVFLAKDGCIFDDLIHIHVDKISFLNLSLIDIWQVKAIINIQFVPSERLVQTEIRKHITMRSYGTLRTSRIFDSTHHASLRDALHPVTFFSTHDMFRWNMNLSRRDI